MTSHIRPCPIWETTPPVQDIPEVGHPYTLPRAGGRFWLMQSGAPLLQRLTDRQKANLSYWIYHHNLRYRLFDESPGSGEVPVVLDQDWVDAHRDRTPPASERILTYLRELIRCDDAGENPISDAALQDLQLAAGGCRDHNDMLELQRHAVEQGWTGSRDQHSSGTYPNRINLSARIYVEEQLGVVGRSRQGFVAMWLDESMDMVYEDGIAPALKSAGYKSLRIDRKEYLGNVTDEIVAEIRKSRFVVADFTASKKSGARGGVYYEAGFAHGLGHSRNPHLSQGLV